MDTANSSQQLPSTSVGLPCVTLKKQNSSKFSNLCSGHGPLRFCKLMYLSQKQDNGTRCQGDVGRTNEQEEA